MTEFLFCTGVWVTVFTMVGFVIGYVVGRLRERQGWKELMERLQIEEVK